MMVGINDAAVVFFSIIVWMISLSSTGHKLIWMSMLQVVSPLPTRFPHCIPLVHPQILQSKIFSLHILKLWDESSAVLTLLYQMSSCHFCSQKTGEWWQRSAESEVTEPTRTENIERVCDVGWHNIISTYCLMHGTTGVMEESDPQDILHYRYYTE